jgi:hypothetical protein
LVGDGLFVVFFFVIFLFPSLPILVLLIFLGFFPWPPLPVHLDEGVPTRRPQGKPPGAHHFRSAISPILDLCPEA